MIKYLLEGRLCKILRVDLELLECIQMYFGLWAKDLQYLATLSNAVPGVSVIIMGYLVFNLVNFFN